MRVSRSLAPLWALLLLAAGAATASPSVFAPLSDGRTVELPELDPDIPAPEEVLGYRLGERFTHWERILDYLDRLEAASDRVTSLQYGETYEGRPLRLLAISSAANLARLDEIRQRQVQLADPRRLTAEEQHRLIESAPVVVWLGYGVHGNESSSAEAAVATAYALAAGTGEWAEALEQAVVLIDPLVNPDGRERYVHFFESRRGREADPSPVAAEHHEPWPGGRQNHYLVDLNRDWAWATQTETRARLAAYRSWEPHVFVDFHEMYPEASYFFPPSTEPILEHIPARTVDWLEVFGRANGAAFDRQGWMYYVGENFDLFYPGYGDSYPALRGAVGMTYEMAGHSRAGQSYRRNDGSLLTLADRVARHTTTSLTTVRTAVARRGELLEDFVGGRRAAVAAPARHYLWEADQAEAAAAAELLTRHGLELGRLAAETRLRTRPAGGGEPATRTFPAGTWLVSTAQPLGNLVRALMELEAPMPEGYLERQRDLVEENRFTEFYDITAWALPLSFGLDVWVSEGAAPALLPAAPETGSVSGTGDYGFLVPPRGLAGYRFAAALQRRGIRYRLALERLSLGGREFPAGSLFVPRSGNGNDLESELAELAAAHGVTAMGIGSGYGDRGISLGSNSVVSVRPPRVGLVGGEGTSPTSFGFLWHLLDRDVEIPTHRLDAGAFGAKELAELDVLILPSGSYGSLASDTVEAVDRWVRGGGLLVAEGRAVAWAQRHELTAVESWAPEEVESAKLPTEVPALAPSDRELYTPGAALATRLSRAHPLAVGLTDPPAAIYQGSSVLMPSGDPRQDVLTARGEAPVIAGFAWPEASERLAGSLLVSVEERGEGAVVLFAQSPAYRLFWRATAPLFLNSVLFGPSLQEQRRLTE